MVVFFALDGDRALFVAALTAGSAAGGIAYGGQAKADSGSSRWTSGLQVTRATRATRASVG